MDKKLCTVCGAAVKGRSDKVFCSANCKSIAQYERRQENERFYLEVEGKLRTNRKLLKRFNAAGYSTVTVGTLIGEGFDPNFFTHYWKNGQGEVYLFCYEFGFLRKMIRGKQRYVLVIWQDYMKAKKKQ